MAAPTLLSRAQALSAQLTALEAEFTKPTSDLSSIDTRVKAIFTQYQALLSDYDVEIEVRTAEGTPAEQASKMAMLAQAAKEFQSIERQGSQLTSRIHAVQARHLSPAPTPSPAAAVAMPSYVIATSTPSPTAARSLFTHEILNDIARNFNEGKAREAEGKAREAEEAFGRLPDGVRGQVYGMLWRICGCPTDKSARADLRGIAHSDFGKAAFHGNDGRSATPPQKAIAIQIISLTLAVDEIVNLLRDGSEASRTKALALYETLPPIIQGGVAGRLWEVMGSPSGHGDFGKAAFYHRDGISSSKEQKIAALEQVRKELASDPLHGLIDTKGFYEGWKSIDDSSRAGADKNTLKRDSLRGIIDFYASRHGISVNHEHIHTDRKSYLALMGAYAARYPFLIPYFREIDGKFETAELPLSMKPLILASETRPVAAGGSGASASRPADDPAIAARAIIQRYKDKWAAIDASRSRGAEKNAAKKADVPLIARELAVLHGQRFEEVHTDRASCYALMSKYCAKYPFLKDPFVAIDSAFKPDVAVDVEAEKALRRDVWAHTLSCIQAGSYTTPTGKPVPLTTTATAAAGVIPYADAGPRRARDPRTASTIYRLVKGDVISLTQGLAKMGHSTLLIDMASDDHFGGDYKEGARAQEEEICRRSDLAVAMDPKWGVQKKIYYPLTASGRAGPGLYVPGITVFKKGRDADYAPLETPFTTAVGIIAAERITTDNKRFLLKSHTELSDECAARTKEKIRTLLHMAYEKGHTAVVLSALGAGAFENPPGHIAELFRQVITEEFPNCFDVVAFGVLDDHNTGHSHNPAGNFAPFAEMIARLPGGEVYDMPAL